MPEPRNRKYRDVGYWRTRAAEARAIADDMDDQRSRAIMWDIARQYEQLAYHAERHFDAGEH